MFRRALITFVALRVIACPIFCAGGESVRSTDANEQVTGCHCKCEQSARYNGCHLPPTSAPIDNPCPCETGCDCQITTELSSRTMAADIRMSLDVMPLCLETLDMSGFITIRCDDQHSHRTYLRNGRDVRLVFDSLLL